VYKIQTKAVKTWKDNKKELTEYGDLIYYYSTLEYIKQKDIWKSSALKIFLIDIIEHCFYGENVINRINKKLVAEGIDKYPFYVDRDVDKQPILEIEASVKEKYSNIVELYNKYKDAYNFKLKYLYCSFDPGHMCGAAYIYPSDVHNPDRAELIRFLILKHEFETVEIKALIEYNRTLTGSEKRYEKIFVASYCAYKTSRVLLTDGEIRDLYRKLPDDYQDKEKILNEIKKAKVYFAEELDYAASEKEDRLLYRLSTLTKIPSDMKLSEIRNDPPDLFRYDDPPK
jgi:hypothetical protein